METGSLSPYLQVPAICPYTQPDQSILCSPPFHSLKTHLNTYYTPIHACVFEVVSFPQFSPTTSLYAHFLSTIHATCPTHLILLDFLIRMKFGE